MAENNIIPITPTSGVANKLIISVSGDDMIVDYADYGLSFDSSNDEILNAVRGSVQERFNVDMRDPRGDWMYKTRKAVESQNIHLIPNSTAG